MRTRKASIALLLSVAAGCGGGQGGKVTLSSLNEAASCSAPVGTRVGSVHEFPEFGSKLSPAPSDVTPVLNAETALEKVRTLGMLPVDAKGCVELLLGLFADPVNGPPSTLAWAAVVNSEKVWKPDVAALARRCAVLKRVCPTIDASESIVPFQTVVVVDAASGAFIRHMEGPTNP